MNRKVKTVISVAAQIFVFALVVWGLAEWESRGLLPRGNDAPEISAETIQGGRADLQSLRGSAVLIYFFSPHCRMCGYTAANIMSVKQASGGRLKILGVALSWNTRDEVEAYAREKGIDFPVVAAGPELAARYRINAYPTIYIIDEKGKIKSRLVGHTTEAGLRLRLL